MFYRENSEVWFLPSSSRVLHCLLVRPGTSEEFPVSKVSWAASAATFFGATLGIGPQATLCQEHFHHTNKRSTACMATNSVLFISQATHLRLLLHLTNSQLFALRNFYVFSEEKTSSSNFFAASQLRSFAFLPLRAPWAPGAPGAWAAPLALALAAQAVLDFPVKRTRRTNFFMFQELMLKNILLKDIEKEEVQCECNFYFRSTCRSCLIREITTALALRAFSITLGNNESFSLFNAGTSQHWSFLTEIHRLMCLFLLLGWEDCEIVVLLEPSGIPALVNAGITNLQEAKLNQIRQD